MAFKKGQSGNPKGTLNKWSQSVKQMFEDNDFNPLLNLMTMSVDTDDDNIRFQCNKELASYFAPKLKGIEIIGENQSPLSFTINIKKKDIKEVD